MGFSVLSRRESGSEKCPRCSRVNVDFVDMGDGLLACFDCGSVFMTKLGRVAVRESARAVHLEVTAGVDPMAWTTSCVPVDPVGDVVAVPMDGFECGACGKVLKTKLGLSGHMRSHKKDA